MLVLLPVGLGDLTARTLKGTAWVALPSVLMLGLTGLWAEGVWRFARPAGR